MSSRLVKNNLPQLLAAMKALAKREVLVGIPSDTEKNVRDDAPITNAEIGYINEFGEPSLNIPERPFLIPGVSAAWPECEKRMARGAKKIISGQFSDPLRMVDAVLDGAGLIAQGEVQQKINDGLEPQLAAATLAARRARGFKGETPLIVTGSLKASITYVVKDA